MLVHRLRRWPNIETTLDQRLVLSESCLLEFVNFSRWQPVTLLTLFDVYIFMSDGSWFSPEKILSFHGVIKINTIHHKWTAHCTVVKTPYHPNELIWKEAQ